MAKMGFPSWLLVIAVLSQGVWGRPPVREVKLITQPSPGQEFVSIQSSVFSQKAVRTPPSQPGTQEPEGDFATSHKIPGQLPVDEPEDEDDIELAKALELPGKIKRDDAEALTTLQGAILTPDLLPIAEESSPPKTEFRMEFSVVTSKPRKEVKEYKEKSVVAASKIAVNPKKVALKSVDKDDDVPEFEVEVDSKGNFGKLDAGLTGSDEKKVMAKKQSAAAAAAAASAGKETVKGQDQILKEVEINPASEVGVKSREVESEVGAITVPFQKQQSVRYGDITTTVSPSLSSHAPSAENGYDILPVNLVKNTDKIKEKDFDFVDSPLADKVLVPAGSNQQSRIEVKKGPNGQDYEYEYVYYYYDDDENDSNISDKKPAGAKSSSPAPTSTTEAPTTARQHLSEVSHPESGDHVRTRGRTRAPPTAAPEAEVGARNKYASIERTAAPAAPATPDASNEIIPARGSSARSRGRTVTTEEPSTVSAEERLPANTRFPPRSRSNHNSNSISATTPAAAAAQDTAPAAPAPRVRGGSVRRPSLELVDSSSFKTQSSDASRDQDLRPEFPASLPAANEQEEVEEVVKPSRGSRVRGHTSTAAPEVNEEEEDEDISNAPRRGQPIRRPSAAEDEEEELEEDSATEPAAANPSSGVVGTTTKAEDVGLTQAAMDKAAIELYSLFQQAQAENSIDEESTDLSAEEEVTTELEEITTTQEATTTPTTTTTTTTVAPTTTTTEATTTAATGRGRYRPRGGNAGATRTKSHFRGNKEEATSTTTEAPAETSTKARRFGANRVTSGSYGRRGFSKATTTHPEEHSDSDKEEAVKEVAKVDSAAPAVRTGAFSRNRFSAGRTSRVTTSTTASPTPSEDSAPSSPSSSAPNKPAFADRFNSLRRRGGLKQSTTVAPLNEETKSESSGEETNEPSTQSDAPTTTAKPLGRTRLSIGSGPRPVRPGPRVNIGGRGRLGATTTTTAAPSTELDEGSNEQTSSSSQDEAQSQSDEAQEALTTPVPDALTRLRNRPRLRVNAAKQVATTAASVVRRPLGLLPRRRPHPAEVKEASDSESQDSSNASSNSEESEVSPSSEDTSEASTDATSSATTVQEQPQENNRLSSLLAGRRRGNNALRRQRNLFPSGPKQTQAEGSS